VGENGGTTRFDGLMAIFGNVITALSWFGVNMLGIGLHSYGFMDKAFPWIVVFSVSQFILMALGALPVRFWSSPNVVSRSNPLPPRAVALRTPSAIGLRKKNG
jgi:hypothetical protein